MRKTSIALNEHEMAWYGRYGDRIGLSQAIREDAAALRGLLRRAAERLRGRFTAPEAAMLVDAHLSTWIDESYLEDPAGCLVNEIEDYLVDDHSERLGRTEADFLDRLRGLTDAEALTVIHWIRTAAAKRDQVNLAALFRCRVEGV